MHFMCVPAAMPLLSYAFILHAVTPSPPVHHLARAAAGLIPVCSNSHGYRIIESQNGLGWNGPQRSSSSNPCHRQGCHPPGVALSTTMSLREGCPQALCLEAVLLLSPHRTPPAIKQLQNNLLCFYNHLKCYRFLNADFSGTIISAVNMQLVQHHQGGSL